MRRFIQSAFCIALLSAASIVMAQPAGYPDKPIRWVISTAAGGGSDSLARLIGQQMAAQMGQSLVIDNRPGGASLIAAENVVRSPADGYTLFSADNGTLIFNTVLFKKLPYDPVRDFSPVGLTARFPLVLATHPASGFNTAQEALAAIRSSPGKYSYASSGVGSPHHLAMEMLKERAKLDINHVPYKGGALAMQDVVGGQVPFIVIDTATANPMIKAGRLKVLAAFSRQRMASLPSTPTLIELGYTDIEAAAWQGLVVASSTPTEVVARLGKELRQAIETPAIKAKMIELGVEPTPSDANAMRQYWAKEAQYWPQLIRERRISLD
ncbi:MAG: tripartite tricarboxylate transporter substrate binding protein [Pseudomonadota bacterium]